MCTTSFHPPFGKCSKILNSVRASNLVWFMLGCKNLRAAIGLSPQCRDLCQIS